MIQTAAAKARVGSGDSTGYRADIDGLRGIGMLVAIGFHARLPGAGGGFTAIDMFFVISGFVITRMIMAQQHAGTFNLRTFFVRRILRLVPATVPLLALTTIGSAVLMSQQEFQTYLRSVVAMVLFYANFFFYYSTNYFHPMAETQPLLHSWSLSFEEQFYLLWPIAMLLGTMWFKRTTNFAIMGSALLTSLALMLWLYPERVNAAYYMLPARAWEIMAGIIIAYLNPFRLSDLSRAILSATGLLALIGSFFFIRPTGGYPSILAIIPVLATVAIIIAADFPKDQCRRPSLANQILGMKGIVWIGLISYSIYLWHWPILTLVKLYEVFPLPVGWRAALMLLAIPVAWASYVWVERPMRRLARHRFAGRIATAVLVGSIFFSIGLVFTASEMNKHWQTAPRLARAIAEQGRAARMLGGCHGWRTDRAAPGCRHAPVGKVKGEWLLIGDSHAEALAHGLANALVSKEIALTHLSQSSCATGEGFEVWMPEGNAITTQCAAANRRIVDDVIGARKIDTLVIASHWPVYAPSPMWDGIRAIALVEGKPVSLEARLQQFIDDVHRRYGKAVKVVLLSPIPVPGIDVPKCVLRTDRLARSTDRCLNQPIEVHNESIASSRAMLKRVAVRTGTVVEDGSATFCDANKCMFGDSKALWWRDDNHLSSEGSAKLGSYIVDQLVAPELQ